MSPFITPLFLILILVAIITIIVNVARLPQTKTNVLSGIVGISIMLIIVVAAIPGITSGLDSSGVAGPTTSSFTITQTQQSSSSATSTIFTTTISSTSTTQTVTNSTISITTTTTTNNSQSNPLWNSNSQAVADFVVRCGWNSELKMLHDMCEPGCNDYVGGNACDRTYWTTSDNVPTCWTLGDFNYTTIMKQCEKSDIALGAFSFPLIGERYEVYIGVPIISGNACCHHTIILPPANSSNNVVCDPVPPPCSGLFYGTTLDGLTYNVQSDAWNGKNKQPVDVNAGVDIAAPQAINAWLRGDLNTFTTIENNLINKYVNTNYLNSGSTWQLGQVMFVMRIGGMDKSVAFQNMQTLLWSLQDPSGFLPNQYNGLGQPGSGHDPENEDAGLLPYSYSLITNIQNSFGKYNLNSPPQ